MIVGRHYPELDGLRGVAIILVLMCHSTMCGVLPQNGFEWLYLNIVVIGWIGVDLFFVLSGFLITGILIDTANSANYFKNFYIRRALRVFPLYYAALALYFLGLYLYGYQPEARDFSYLGYIQNFFGAVKTLPAFVLDPFWSLAVEEQFYLLWPSIFLLAYRAGHLKEVFIATLLFSLATRFALTYFFNDSGFVYKLTSSHIDFLIAGGALAHFFTKARDIKKYAGLAQLAVGAATTIILIIFIKYGNFKGDLPEILRFGMLPLLIFLTGILYLSLAAEENSWFRKALKLNFLRSTGKISYGIYIFHFPINVAVHKTEIFAPYGYIPAQILTFLTVFLLSFLIAFVSYNCFEKHFLKLKDRWAAYN